MTSHIPFDIYRRRIILAISLVTIKYIVLSIKPSMDAQQRNSGRNRSLYALQRDLLVISTMIGQERGNLGNMGFILQIYDRKCIKYY